MSKDIIKLQALIQHMSTCKYVEPAHIALAQDYLRKISEDMEGMEFNEKHLRKDCDRLRRELDDCNGVIR